VIVSITTESLTFDNGRGDRLAARLERPETARGFALFAPCFTCGKDHLAAVRISRRLAELGIATLRLDFTGLGDSEGEFGTAGFSDHVADLVAAAAFLDARREAPALLVGHSLGGATAIAAASQIVSVKAVATIGAPFDIEHVLEHFGPALREIEAEGEAEVTLAGREFEVSDEFIAETRGHDQAARLAELGRALLVMHAPTDSVVGIENAGEIFAAAKHPKSFVSLADADHLLTREEDADYAAEIIAAWVARWL
jgi:putative redox protein